jgi:hypothetical protein
MEHRMLNVAEMSSLRLQSAGIFKPINESATDLFHSPTVEDGTMPQICSTHRAQ